MHNFAKTTLPNGGVNRSREETTFTEQHKVLLMSAMELSSPLKPGYEYAESYRQPLKRDGPRFPDGTINWTCDCMGGGTMVAHRCGYYFRNLYRCMMDADDAIKTSSNENTAKCPGEFVDWIACIQNLDKSTKDNLFQKLAGADDEPSPA